jgi:sulfatase maturation enzyme AslB (radical SAM superfamily)
LYKVVHIEPTDVCQAACPLCARETDDEFNKRHQHHLTVEQIKQHFSEDTIRGLDKMFMCGNYGDPAAGRHTLEIYRYFRSINPTIVLGMNTNGAVQNIAWWSELAGILNQPRDYVVFSIDGLKDTNHIYRKNVSWSKLMDNAETFIAAEGRAQWDMLVYQHNEHQVDACEQLARDMRFTWFRAKVSRRPYINGLKFPVGWQQPNVNTGPIECIALKESSVYIDAQGRVSACCWLGSTQTDFITLEQAQATWATDPHPTCRATCSGINNSFTNQWRREVQLC